MGLKELVKTVLDDRQARRAGGPTQIRVVKTTTRNPDRPELSNNGGDYWFGYVQYFNAVTGAQIGVARNLTSAEFDYCEWCGIFTSDCACERGGLSHAQKLTLDIRRALYDDFDAGSGPARKGRMGVWQLVEYSHVDLDPK